MSDSLTIGYSPCPNDTFIFDALVNGRIDTEGLTFHPTLADVEELNTRAFREELTITKLSYHAFGHLAQQYRLLRSGSALGRGVGPLLVFSKKENFEGVNCDTTVAIPGRYTTANYLLGLAYPAIRHKAELRFDLIEDAVLDGTFDTGLLIHENRFTYAERGLQKLADLGEYWERATGHPIPLGGIAVSRKLPVETQRKINRLIHQSIRYAFDHPRASEEYVARHAQSMDPRVRRKHIDLYVNEYTLDLGAEGEAAVRHFIKRGRKSGVLPAGTDDYIVA